VVEIPIREPAVLHTVLVALTASNLVDIVSGLVGRGASRRPLPRLSPSKTWRGFVGGLVASIAFATALAAIGAPPGQVVVWCLAVWLLTSTGDLVGSKLKRLGQVKDFSHHLGPHGGFMDRMDAIAPVIVCACLTA
jgi:phosphatidate cytidylyltransferase